MIRLVGVGAWKIKFFRLKIPSFKAEAAISYLINFAFLNVRKFNLLRI